MKQDRKRTCFSLWQLGTVLAVWLTLLGLSWCAAEYEWSGELRVQGFMLAPAAALAVGVIFARRKKICAFLTGLSGWKCFSSKHSRTLKRGVAVLCTVTLTLSMVTLPADAAVLGGLADANIGLSDSFTEGSAPTDGTNPTDSTYSWSASGTNVTGTVTPGYATVTTSGCNSTTTYYYRTSASSALTITNNSGGTCLLSFNFTASPAGTLEIDGAKKTAAGSFSKQLADGETVTVTLTTPATCVSTNSESASKYAATTTLSNILLSSVDGETSVTLLPVTVGGSYTAKVGTTTLTIGDTYTNKATTEYTFTATAAANYVFDGWYVNGTRVATTTTMTSTFPEDSSVEARFIEDPLYSVISLGENSGGTKADYVEVKSAYYHSETGSTHTNVGDLSANNSYGAATKFPNSQWSAASSTAVTSTASGTATGDNQTSLGYSRATANIYSDIIRIKCLQNCEITFTANVSAGSMDNINEASQASGVYFYYYVGTSGSANASTITSNGTALVDGKIQSSGNGTATVTVNAGEYLYFYARASTMKSSMKSSGYVTDNYSYTATISDISVIPNTVEYTFTTGNMDNTGAQLKSGSVKINGTAQSVSSGSYTTSTAGGSVLTLTPGTAPTNYVFIGWHNVTDSTYLYTSGEYEVTMTKDYEVNPIYVPVMTITTGGTNGYESASYTYKNVGGQTVTPNGQYVARNADCTAFYSSLADAFSSENTIVLLAGDTINGDLTIPAGKTLVIPNRLADDGPVTPAQVTISTSISSYCKVTFDGNLTVDGTLVVSARQSSTASGRAAGGIGFLSMSDSSTVMVNSGGILCGFGEIRGGSITAENGAVVREFMEISDKRAVLVMNNINDQKGTKGVFPFSNFSVKTIESPVTYETGAKLYAQYSVLLEGGNGSAGEIPLIGTVDCLFNLTAGTMTKSFDLALDKTVYHVDEGGAVTTGGFTLSLTFAVGGLPPQTVTINTQEYWMPLNAGFSVQTAGDLTMNSSFKFLPGASLSVEKTGTCTISSGQNLLFYRLNDYDTRGIGTSTYQKGYSAKAYPVNATNLPGGGYTHPTLATVGSARLNVDGQMVVNGGLYVSNDLVKYSDQGITYTETVDGVEKTRSEINDAYFKLYDSGYNVLTGTGCIEMSNANVSTTVVYEAMTASNTNDPAFDAISITPIAGLTADATADDPGNYNAFSGGSTFYGTYRPYDGGIYVWGATPFPQVAVVIGEGNDTQAYISLADAVYAYAGTGYIQMIANSTESNFTLSKNLTLDLNGKTVNATVTVADGYTLSGVDSSTNGFQNATTDNPLGAISVAVAGTGKVVVVTNLNSKDYVAVQTGNTYSFHRFAITPIACRFYYNPGAHSHLAFKAVLQGDDTVIGQIKDLGFAINGEDLWYGGTVALAGTDEELFNGKAYKTVSLVAVDYEGTAGFGTKYDVTAKASFGEDHSDIVSGAAGSGVSMNDVLGLAGIAAG